MGIPGKGHLSYLQFAEESSYGTAVASTHKIEVINMDIGPFVGVVRDPSLYDGVSRRGIFQGGTGFRGRFTTRMNYEGMGVLLKATLGGTPTVSGSNPYTHTFKEGSTPPSLTLQCIEGNVPAGGYFRVDGAYITAMTLRGSAGQGEDSMVQAEFEVVAKSKVSVASAPASVANFPALEPLLFHQTTTVDTGTNDSAADVRLRSFELSYRNSYDLERFYFGSTTVDQPIRNGFVECRWRITQEFQTKSQFDNAVAFATERLDLVFTSGTKSFRASSGSAVITEYANPIEGYGIIMANSTWEAYRNASDGTSLIIVNVNSKPAYNTAN
jgi:hypothetical protein